MKHFILLKRGLDLAQMRSEIAEYDRWEDLSVKEGVVPTHKNTFRIQLRTAKTIPGLTYHNIHETVDMPAWSELPCTRSFVVDFLEEIGGEVGHVRLAKMPGKGKIKPHIDEGSYFAVRNRYHLVVHAPAGTRVHAGNETVVMREDELWWFDNKQVHSVENLSDTPRVHLVFDVLPSHFERSR